MTPSRAPQQYQITALRWNLWELYARTANNYEIPTPGDAWSHLSMSPRPTPVRILRKLLRCSLTIWLASNIYCSPAQTRIPTKTQGTMSNCFPYSSLTLDQQNNLKLVAAQVSQDHGVQAIDLCGNLVQGSLECKHLGRTPKMQTYCLRTEFFQSMCIILHV